MLLHLSNIKFLQLSTGYLHRLISKKSILLQGGE